MVSFLYAQLMNVVFVLGDGTSGLSGLWDSVLQNWLTPAFLAIVAVSAFFFIKNRQWTALISFVGIAIIVGALVLAGGTLFGNKGKTAGFTKMGEAAGTKLAGENSGGY